MLGSGNQLCIQRPEKGPTIHLLSNIKFSNDLIKVENVEKQSVFCISHEETVSVNGTILTNECINSKMIERNKINNRPAKTPIC